MRYTSSIIAFYALICLVQLASAAPASGLSGPRRMLLQTLTADEAQAQTVKDLQKIQDGDEKERNLFVELQYYYIGCGGKTRQRDPEELAQNMIYNGSKTQAYIKGGVVDTWKEIIEEALSRIQDSPPSTEECDTYWGTKGK